MSKEQAEILERLAEGQISTDEVEQQLLALREVLPEPPFSGGSDGHWNLFNWLAFLFGTDVRLEEPLDWSLDGAGVSTIHTIDESIYREQIKET